MNEEDESGIKPINKNQKKTIIKSKVNCPRTISPQTVKKVNKNNDAIENKNIKCNYHKIIISNIKKYNFNEYKHNLRIINNLILHKKTHFISILQEKIIFYYRNEFLKKYYLKIDIIKRFPKFNLYYKNYFKFFLKPTLSDFYFNEIIRKNSNKHATVFYDKYNDNMINKNKQSNIKSNFKSIFTKAQKMEIQNIINNSKNKKNNNKENEELENENKSFSTIVFSYESLNDSKNNIINSSKEDPSNSLISITNLINQSKIVKNKSKEKNENKYFKNKINLFLNLEDKTITQKSTLLSSTRSKKYETIKEKTNTNNNNINKIIKERHNKNNKICIVKNKKENEYNICQNIKSNNMNNKNIFLQQRSKSNKMYQKRLDNFSKTKKCNEIIIIPTKNNLLKYNNTSENNNNIYYKNKIQNELFLKSNSNININSCKNRISLFTLTNNNYYKQTTKIINNNIYDKNNFRPYSCNNIFGKNGIKNEDLNVIHKNKSPNNFKVYYSSSTQITKIKKKKLFSRNLTIDLAHPRNGDRQRKNNYFYTTVNQINKDSKININNNEYLNSNIFYNSNKIDKKPINTQEYLNNNNEVNTNIYYYTKYKSYNSSIENNKMKLNKLIKEIENLNILKNNMKKYNDKDKLKVYEYKNKK